MAEEARPLSDLAEAGDDPTGLLWLINRTVFHPRGLALALVTDTTGNVVGWLMQGDGSEPFTFTPEDDDEQFGLVRRYLAGVVADPFPVDPDLPVIGANPD